MNERFKKTLGMRVRLARQNAGMTQEQLAAAVKRSTMSVSKIERGLQLPDLTTLIAVSKAVGGSLNSLVEEAGSSHGKSMHRQQLEARLEQLVGTLSDTHLTVAIEQIEVLVQHRKELGAK